MPSVRSRGERVREAAALSAVGGFLDAYTFLTHGGVFANAQTGNVVLFGLEAAQGSWPAALRHVPPVLAFAVGIATVEALARMRRLLAHPTRAVLMAECIVFVVVGLTSMPDVLATILIAWAATLQVGTFRTVRDSTYNTTFTTGNLRSLVSESSAWLVDRDRAAASRARALSAVVLAFATGAVLGGLGVRGVHDYAVLLVVPVLLAVLAGVVRDTERLNSGARRPGTQEQSAP